MYGRAGLERFKKAQSSDPFSVTVNSAPKTTTQHASKPVIHPSVQYLQSQTQTQYEYQPYVPQKPTGLEAGPLVGQTQQVTHVGGGQSTWQPPDWAIEPRPGVYYLEVLKDGEVLDRINLDRRRHIFGRQSHTCDYVLDHHVFVIDLGSAHGTFVANERLTKDTPVELEVGQSLRFAASTRTYILRKNDAALFPRPPPPSEINLPPPPDPSDEEAVVAYNTLLNRYGLGGPDLLSRSSKSGSSASGKEQLPAKENNASQTGVTNKLQEVLNKVKTVPKSGVHDDLYGEAFSGKLGSSWAYPMVTSGGKLDPSTKDDKQKDIAASSGKLENNSNLYNDDNDDDLFGD
ncbi:hypothetical protein GH714_011501 [Hevea brasiliensis]|uniref:FHA domain-containing protein n=1 Tax=Hevea brasiliensis TaxID=3981 RepID=A0A6A6LZY6_HEVBR|nr:hypothetical protein GH714_011501 [Hevea brasiliensis]